MSVKQDALKALDGMATIVRSEMLVHGDYVTGVEVPERKDAICGGRRACAVGSLWIAGGVRARGGKLPGVFGRERSRYMRQRPDLRLAVAALNLAAHEKATKLEISRELDENGFPEAGYDPSSIDYIERFFEEDLPQHVTDDDDGYIASRDERKIMLSVIKMAQSRIDSGKVKYRNGDIHGVPDELRGYTA